MERVESYKPEKQTPISVEDPEEARESVLSLLEKGELPCVSVPKQYLPALQKGLVAHTSWIPGMDAIVGTLGREPYLPKLKNDERIIVRIKNISPQNIKPRFTGPDKAFHGVVLLNGPIPPENLEVVYA